MVRARFQIEEELLLLPASISQCGIYNPKMAERSMGFMQVRYAVSQGGFGRSIWTFKWLQRSGEPLTATSTNCTTTRWKSHSPSSDYARIIGKRRILQLSITLLGVPMQNPHRSRSSPLLNQSLNQMQMIVLPPPVNAHIHLAIRLRRSALNVRGKRSGSQIHRGFHLSAYRWLNLNCKYPPDLFPSCTIIHSCDVC